MTHFAFRTTVPVALAFAAILLSADEGHALTSAQPETTAASVTVANLPSHAVAVVQTDVMSAVQVRVVVPISDGSNEAPETTVYTVPVGKRFVCQTLGVFRNGVTTSQTVQVFVNPYLVNGYGSYALPPVGPGDYSGVTENMVFYADSTTPIVANAYRSGSSGAELEYLTLTGYLVNAQ